MVLSIDVIDGVGTPRTIKTPEGALISANLPGTPYRAFSEYNRATGATDYTSNDIISTSGGYVVPFTSIALAAAGKGSLTGAFCIQKCYTTTTPELYMIVFAGAAAPTAIADNAAAAISHANMNELVDVIPLSTRKVIYDGGGTAANGIITHSSGAIWIDYGCGAGQTTLWAMLLTGNSFTPVASSTWRLGLAAIIRS